MFTADDLVHSFTRKDAFDEGMLIDATAMAAEAGFRVPLALTDTVWADCVAWPEGTKGGWGQSQDGRLWDVLYMAGQAARRARSDGGARVAFQVYRVPRSGWRATKVELVLTIGPGDDGAPVATVLAPGEE
jgi:hypothetical protein